MAGLNRRPTRPGTILAEYYLKPRGISVTRFADATGVSRKHVSNIVNGRAAITPRTAVRFARVLDTTPEFWLNLQNAIDLHDASRKHAAWKPKAMHPASFKAA
jgi:addiction module HigA family antidote